MQKVVETWLRADERRRVGIRKERIMGVYIRNIDIPEIKRGVAAIINIDDIVFFKTTDDILLVPDHGDLIERDALKEDMDDKRDCETLVGIEEAIKCADAAPVVIPAERSEE